MKLSKKTLSFGLGALALNSLVTLAACDDTTGTGGAGGATSSSASSTKASSSVATTTSVGTSMTASVTATASSTSSGMASLAINGDYVDDFMYEWTITDPLITIGTGMDSSKFAVESYDNATLVIGAENDAMNMFNPGKFSRFDWTISNSELYVCQTAFNADTLAAALATPRADEADLQGGCGGFGWSRLTPKP